MQPETQPRGLRRILVDAVRVRLKNLLGLHLMEQKIDALLSNGTRANYMGDNRVLVRVLIEGRNIVYMVEGDDKLLSPWFIATGDYETDVTRFFLRHMKTESHSLDIGANFGFFTCLMARFCPAGKVIGVEADERIWKLARDNIAINGLADIATARHAAVGETCDPVTLYRRDGRSGNTSIAAVPESFTQHMGERPVVPFTVSGLRVDDLLPEMDGRIDFMKVDVEGAEPLVFRGAAETIARNRQIAIVMEWSPGQIRHAGFDIPQFLASLDAMGLRAFDLVKDVEQPLTFEALQGIEYRGGVVLRHARA